MEVQNTRISEARPKRKEKKNKTRPEPRKHTKDPSLAPLFSALCDFFRIFLSLRYSADFGRSRLVIV